MKIKVLKTEQEYNEACNRMYEIIHSTENDILPESLEGEELELLSLLVEDYERKMNYKLSLPDAIETIKYRMTERNMKQKDLIPILGSKGTVSKILKKQRSLTMEMVRNISKFMDIPVNMLVV